MFKAIVFDMDGLMFDTERLFVKAWDYAGEKLGLGELGYMNLKTLGMNVTAAREVWQAELGKNFDEEGIYHHANIFINDYYNKHGLPAKPGLFALLEYLCCKPYKLAIASSTYYDEIIENLKRVDILQYFDIIVGGDMIKNSKPHPDIYLKACDLLAENPINCMALEDSKNGILSASSAGCKTIMIPDLWQADSETEKLLFAKLDSLYDVMALI